MATQTTISQYFTNRKRGAVDEIKSVNQDKKVLILDTVNSSDVSSSDGQDDERLILKRKISWDCAEDTDKPKRRVVTPIHHNPKGTPKFATIRSSVKKARAKSVEKSSTRKSLFSNPIFQKDKSQSLLGEASDDSSNDTRPLTPFSSDENSPVPDDNPTTSDVTENLSYSVLSTTVVASSEPQQVVTASSEEVPSSSHVVNQPAELSVIKSNDVTEPKPSTSKKKSLREELGISEIKTKLKGNSRLDKIRDAIKKINKGYDRLAEIQAKKDNCPSLKRFDTIELEVPCSPVKTPFKMESMVSSPSKLREAVFKSPAKGPAPPGTRELYVSPRKLLDQMRSRDTTSTVSSASSPVYERYSAIAAQAGKPCLPLPYSYRLLGEIFRSIEVVVSMMHNRKEIVYFSKLKRSAQELSKKTLSEHHLGQILKVFPSAFRLTYERVKIQGKPDKYELTIHPILPNNAGNNSDLMVPSTILDRQRYFYKELLDIVKTHHEAFLLSLDPPLIVDKEKLTRWHPGFDLDSCPDIESVDLPQVPPMETFSSAKHLLGKAKEMFIINPRMEKAMEKLAQCDNRTNSDGKPSAASAIPGLASALKGIPKSLLEKVRAKQAAKAVEMLTRDPEKAKRDIEVSRLPEMARILRNLYVCERKNVMEKSQILAKLASSFRENLSPIEMNRHLMLLVEKTPGWLKCTSYGHVIYISMDKNMEMKNVFNLINRSS